ncbi:MAG: acyl--CoA ligase [Frankiaceae bacterium]|nr:acyl--CoA ligase [Frankiaceae bacterium]MBV9870177.1 acyl--CoA ligase [Frankiaceae bacterium]
MARSEIAGPSFDAAAFVAGGRPLTMGGFLLEVCRRYPANEALVFDDPLARGQTVRWSYDDLARASRQVARALVAAGVKRGDRVATLMANRPEAVAAYFGASLAGAVIAPLSTFATVAELDAMLAKSEADVLLLQATMGKRDFAADVAKLSQPLRVVATVGEPSWSTFVANGDAVDDEVLDAIVAATDPSDEALIIFSSGTTAEPKGMLHRHQAPTLQFWLQSELFGRTEATRMWTALPLFWTAGMNTAMGATLAAGGCWVMQEGFDAGIALLLMQRERVTEPYTLPHQATTLMEHPDWLSTDLSSLRCVYGKAVFARHPSVNGDTNWQMPVGWGMSETCAFISALPSTAGRDAMKASLGRLLPGNRLKVTPDGEFLIKGPTLMERYLGKTREECVDAEGWFHTGDIGTVDEDENVHWEGRRNEMIKTGGANVAPAEIEVAMRAFPAVILSRVIAMPDPRLEQIAVLCVELPEDTTVTDADITAFLRERLASYKVPKRILTFAPGEIPLTSSGTKVVDDELRKLVEARMTTTETDV